MKNHLPLRAVATALAGTYSAGRRVCGLGAKAGHTAENTCWRISRHANDCAGERRDRKPLSGLHRRVRSSRTDYHPFDARRAAAGRDRTAVQRPIADLAGYCVTIQPDAIDDALVASLRQVCESLRLDHAILWRTNGDDTNIVASHSGSQHRLRPLPQPRVLAAIPFIASKQQEREAVFFTRLDR